MPSKLLVNERLITQLYASHRNSEYIARVFDISMPTLRRIVKRNNGQQGAKYSLNENAFSVQTPESCWLRMAGLENVERRNSG
jgi:hypothetical protein